MKTEDRFEIYRRPPTRTFEMTPKGPMDWVIRTPRGMRVSRRRFLHITGTVRYTEERITMECPIPLKFRTA